MSFACHTAPGVTFETLEELKAHYHTDWHRYNLKRKVAALPMLTQKMFDRVVSQTLSLANDEAPRSGVGHRGIRARQQTQDEDSEQDADAGESDGSEWEELSGDEAEAVMQEVDRRRAQGGPRRQAGAASASEQMQVDEHEDTSELVLANNGFELVANNKLIGSRDLARFYRQRHRPPPQSQHIISVATGDKRSGLVGTGGLKTEWKPPVTEILARAQKVERIHNQRASLRLGVQSSGPMFRGFRE